MIETKSGAVTQEVVGGDIHRMAKMALCLVLVHDTFHRDPPEQQQLPLAGPHDIHAVSRSDLDVAELVVRGVAQRVVVVRVTPLNLDLRLTPKGDVRVAH